MNITKEDQFIEKFGTFFEKSGRIPRIAGKIFAYLLICPTEEQTAQQIIKRLKIAKSSFSSMIKILIDKQVVEEITMPEKRSRYYRIKQGGWEKLFLAGLSRIASIRGLLQEGKYLINGERKGVINRIEELDKLYNFFEDEIPELIKKWKKYNKKNKKEVRYGD